jgi:hypothetical protein
LAVAIHAHAERRYSRSFDGHWRAQTVLRAEDLCAEALLPGTGTTTMKATAAGRVAASAPGFT